MSDEPNYPADAAVGDEAAKQPREQSQAEGNAAGTEGPERRRKNYVKTGVAVGIGSAAIVAALLYANRGRRNEDRNG